jgi:hypothetical protein
MPALSPPFTLDFYGNNCSAGAGASGFPEIRIPGVGDSGQRRAKKRAFLVVGRPLKESLETFWQWVP